MASSATSPGSPNSGANQPGRARRRRKAVIESDPEDDTAMDTTSGKPAPAGHEAEASSTSSSSSYRPSSAATQLYNMDTDISKLEAPTFTTLDRGPSQPMLSLNWDHRLDLIGKKVVNPMIHCCDKCLKPILFYGRMIPCKHVFCLFCAKESEANSARSGKPTACGRCGGDVVRVEQAGLGSIHMCSHGGSRYGNNGCRRTYLSHRDLQAHIQHRHMKAAPAASQMASLPATLPSAAAIAEVTQALIANSNTSRSSSSNKHSSSSSYYGASSSSHHSAPYPSQSSRDSSRRSANNSANSSGRTSYPYASASASSSGNGGAPSSSASSSSGGNTQPISVISSSRQSNLITVPIQDGNGTGNASERTAGASSYGYSSGSYTGGGSSSRSYGDNHHHHSAGGGSFGQQGASSSSSWRTSSGHNSQQTSSSYYRR